jgi:hypothetical protein
MAAKRFLKAYRRNRLRVDAALLLLLFYGACAVPLDHLDDEYGAIVVDAQTGEPIEGAVMVISWITCSYVGMDSCGGVHSPLEAVSGPDGKISMDGTPWPVWNPLRYPSDFPYLEVRAVGYVPFSSSFPTDPSFDELSEAGIARAVRGGTRRIALSIPEYFDGWRNTTMTPREEYEWRAARPEHVNIRDLAKLQNFRRVLNGQRAEFDLPPVGSTRR